MRMRRFDMSARSRMILSMLIFSTIGLFVRYIPLPSSLIACVRGIIGAVCIYMYMRLQGRSVDWTAIRKNRWTLLLSGAALGFNWAFLFEAYRYNVATATLCYYLAPTIVVLVSPLVLKEKLTARKLFGCAAAFAGMVLVSGVLSEKAPPVYSVLWGLAAAVLYACVMLLNKRITGVKSEDRTVTQLAVSALVMLVYAALTEEQLAFELSALPAVLLIAVGIVHTGLAYLYYFGALKDLKAQSAAVLSYLDPAVAIVLSALVLGEKLFAYGWIGAVLILGGALVSELSGNE